MKLTINVSFYSLKRVFKRLVLLFLFLLLPLIFNSETILPEQVFDSKLNVLTANYRFNWVGWTTNAVWEEVEWWIAGRPVIRNQAIQKGVVFAFLDRQTQIRTLESRIQQEYAQLSQSDTAQDNPLLVTMENALTRLKKAQVLAEVKVERILAAQIEAVLIAEGIGMEAEIMGIVLWPPLTFRFTDLPTNLIISPRDHIEKHRTQLLLPGMASGLRNNLEAKIEDEFGDMSALVDNVGGIGLWPTMVIKNNSLPVLLDIIAHEWAHNYYFFKPLGSNYGRNRDITTINETVASIIGGEVSRLTLERFYPELVPPPLVENKTIVEEEKREEPPDDIEVSPAEETFSQAMRRIRLQVDVFLANGQVAEAEQYMETERLKLVAQGYYLRRLNQAYFAFHGSYAISEASVDPIGPWLRQLRAESGSLKAFMTQVALVESLDDLLEMIEDSE